MKQFIFILSLIFSMSSFAYKMNGVRCKDFPKKSCERKECRCHRAVHRKSKGKRIKKRVNKKGKPTIQAFCADHGTDKDAAWNALKEVRPKLRKKCP